MDDKVVRLVCWWSLVCASSTVLSFVGFVDFFFAAATCSPSSWMLPCVVLREERVAEAEELVHQMLWLAAAQAAAATLALLLSRHRRSCWWLALVAHTATFSSHAAQGRLGRILFFAGGDHRFLCIIIVVTDLFFRVTDGIGFTYGLGLLQIRA